ncbi:cardiolipin synthase [Granulosicoccus antarcticus]|uniref:Cardiolipin synthase n=1 Tax=Granulosicoccus antarcticus IMCC3135 TaxID=1192854 RepID=A0A2Z2NY50_9GAMM|nr:cardiolipin synthase [Granulosicoccus antarcticus]ASJ76213.1 Cardiolipin synthase A [Granulosicoccus antarcticus IMCC3135]
MYVLLFHALIVTGLTLRVLLRDDLAPSSRLAWFMVIFILPVAGAIVYFLFGEASLGRSASRRRATIRSVWAESPAILGSGSDLLESIDPAYQPAFSYAASINGFQVKTGNRAELMADGLEARRRLLSDIDAAKVSVNVLYYIWLDDNTGTAVAQALMRAVARGVQCRAMTDGLGSRQLIKSRLWRQMSDAGVMTEIALPLNRPLFTMLTSRIDLRNHRKITVIDGQITYCGSQNCADPEFLVKPKFAPWVDIMLRIEGPVVAQNQLLFASDWMVARKGSLQEFPLSPDTHANGFAASIIGDGPTERAGATAQLFASLIGTATRTLTLSTPYFVPNTTVLNAIQAAAYRGVHVTLIFPERNDSWVVAAASRSFYQAILASGACIFEYIPGLLHSKTLTIDGCITFLGSSNMDLRSFDLNYENDILLQDVATTKAVEQRQEDYLKQSREVTVVQVESWSLPTKLWNNAIATIGPVL